MKLIANILYLEFAELVLAGVSENTLKSVKNKKISCWTFIKDTDDSRRVLIQYETLKPKYKELIIKKYGNPYQYAAQDIITPYLIAKPEDMQTINQYTYTDQFGIKCYLEYEYKTKCIEATKYLALMEQITVLLAKRIGFPTKEEFNQAMLRQIIAKDIKLPKTIQTLYRKLKEYKTQGALCVIDQSKVGNQNATKLGKGDGAEQQKALIVELARRHNNFNAVQLTDMYNAVATQKQWQTISAGTIYNYINKGFIHLTTYAGRRGTRNLDANMLMLNKRRRPTSPLYMVSIDGWDVELAYQRREVVKRKGKKTEITTYDNRLVMVVVLDVYNNYPVGYAIGERENVELIKLAIRNAMSHIEELTGGYYKPWQVQSDRFGLKQMTEFLEGVTKLFIPAQVGNAKAKPIEPYFKELNTTYCQYFMNWTGFGIQARKENQVNREVSNLIKQNFPDKQGCIEQIRNMMNAERSKKQEAWLQRWEQLPAEDKLPMSRIEFLENLGNETGFTNQINGYGLTPTIDGVRHYFDTFDMSFRHLQHIKWRVMYDNNNLDSVLAMSTCSKYKYLLQTIHQPAMAIKDATEKDTQHLSEVRKLNKKIKDVVTERLAKAHELTQDIIKTPELDERIKLLLTDSTGAQKDRKQDIQRKELAEIVESKPKYRIKTVEEITADAIKYGV